MLRHFVLWNFKKETSQKQIDEIVFQLLELKKLNEVLELSVLRSNCPTSTKDLLLNVTFMGQKDMNIYLNTPQHRQVAKLINDACIKRECFDIEM